MEGTESYRGIGQSRCLWYSAQPRVPGLRAAGVFHSDRRSAARQSSAGMSSFFPLLVASSGCLGGGVWNRLQDSGCPAGPQERPQREHPQMASLWLPHSVAAGFPGASTPRNASDTCVTLSHLLRLIRTSGAMTLPPPSVCSFPLGL